jgi:hypothetical protein
MEELVGAPFAEAQLLVVHPWMAFRWKTAERPLLYSREVQHAAAQLLDLLGEPLEATRCACTCGVAT